MLLSFFFGSYLQTVESTQNNGTVLYSLMRYVFQVTSSLDSVTYGVFSVFISN